MEEKYIYIIIGAIIVINIILMVILSSNKKKMQTQRASKQSVATRDEYGQQTVNEHAKTEVLGSRNVNRIAPSPQQQVQREEKTELMGNITNLSAEEKNAIKSSSQSPVAETIVFSTQVEEKKESENVPYAYLLFNENDDQVKVPIRKEATLIGRDPEICDVTITSDNYLGRSHAMLYIKGEKVFLADLSSKNGTFINGEQIKGQVEITYSTKFKVGKTGMELLKVGG